MPLFSGSSGNAVYVELGETRLLVDAGVSGARVADALRTVDVDAASLTGILLTHEHSDHVSGVGVLSRRYNLPIYATEGTWGQLQIGRIDAANVRVIAPGEDFYIGELGVTPFEIPHDAAQPVGYAFAGGGIKAAVATDIGCVKESWIKCVEGADILLLEANHDIEMLKAGRYPYDLKRRILGRKGHLSNEDAGKAAVELHARGVKRIVLGHLSRENNFPELAWRTVANALDEAGIDPEADLPLGIARRDAVSEMVSMRVCVVGGAQYAGI